MKFKSLKKSFFFFDKSSKYGPKYRPGNNFLIKIYLLNKYSLKIDFLSLKIWNWEKNILNKNCFTFDVKINNYFTYKNSLNLTNSICMNDNPKKFNYYFYE